MTNKCSAIPTGYHSITPYLATTLASKAIEFYKQAFAAKEIMRFEGDDGKIGHAELMIGDSKLMIGDKSPEEANETNPSGIAIHLYVEDVDAVVAKSLHHGATLLRDIENKFYGDRSGMIQDPFGFVWNIATHIEDLTPDEIQKRAHTEGVRLKKLTVHE